MTLRRTATLGISFILLVMLAIPAGATVLMFSCHNHPNGDAAPPTYGLRIDDLIGTGIFTFSFDYSDITGSTGVILAYDDVAGTIHIYGRAYGGKDVGGSWDAVLKGWINIDFWYVDNVATNVNSCAGGAGNDVYVTDQSINNGGTFSLDGWGGDAVFAFTDKKADCSFYFDNDSDSKNNGAIAGDPGIWSAAGWLMPQGGSARDWLFTAEMMTVPTENSTWGAVKALYGE